MFKNRNYTKELLDGTNIAETALFQNLKELNTINSLLGGYKISFSAFKKVLIKNRETTIVDIGCGGGDTLKNIDKWNSKNLYKLNLVGVDYNPICIKYAELNNIQNLKFICDDYRNVFNHLDKIDIIHACLFCHHLIEDEIIQLINFCKKNNIILIINDLERNAIAYYAIKLLTKFFSNSYLVKNDAPLSVLRGFKKTEWQQMIATAKSSKFEIRNKWAFRHQIIIYG